MYGAYCDHETQRALGSLLEAFDEQDGDAAKEAINSKALKDLDIDFARLTKQIVLPDSDGLEAAAAKVPFIYYVSTCRAQNLIRLPKFSYKLIFVFNVTF